MKKDKITSDLKSHKYKKGLIQTPMNSIPNQQLVSWIDDRLPEYLWLGLILMAYERTEAIEKIGKILEAISKINKSMIEPKLSIILSLNKTMQEKIYQIISSEIDPKTLAPLTIIYSNSEYPIFNHYFYFHDILFQEKIEKIKEAVKIYYNHQSYEATDLRFTIIMMQVFQNRIHLSPELKQLLVNYPYTPHSDEKMKQYRPFVRVTEMTTGMLDMSNPKNQKFINNFWRKVGMKTNCKPIIIDFNDEEKEMEYKKFIVEFQEKLNHLLNEQKEKSLLDDKFDVIIGTITYTLKIFNDVIEKNLGDSILGRHAFRTILETYINIKYLLKIESEHLNIWKDYKLYGIGKYKLPLLKERENTDKKENTHFVEPLIDMIINEIIWEEFVDIDLRYFDKKKIKEKFEEVGEKYLYEVLYEYDNNFIHGFWGAVRESSMLYCDNATHKYHSIPDINFQQKMPSVNNDIYKIMNKFSKLIDEAL